jgi:hypothetical protein
MTTEQKAKAYDEAIKRGLDYIRHTPATEMVTRQDIFEAIFPEFKEPKDEKIRKSIIELVKQSSEVLNKQNQKDMITWLENQGKQKVPDSSQTCKMETLMTLDEAIEHCKEKSCNDTICGKEHKQLAEWLTELKGYRAAITKETQKSVDNDESKFHEGEWITNGDYTWKIVVVNPLDYTLQSQDGNIVDDNISYVDKHFHLWTIQDAENKELKKIESKKLDTDKIITWVKNTFPTPDMLIDKFKKDFSL